MPGPAVSTVQQMRGSARDRMELEHMRDFNGGLNLKDDPYNLGLNESFDLQNVDIDRRGGFGVRRGMRPFISVQTGFGGGADQAADSGHTYVDQSAVRHLLIARDGNVKRWDGAAWQNVITGLAVQGRTKFEEFRNVLYILPPGQIVPYTWTGAGLATQLTTVIGNYNDDLTAPNAGNFPPCRVMATHKEVMWAGGVVDTGPVTHNSRVRWSHPGAGQDWRTNDFIDIDPDDEKGWIRALVPWGDRLLVFKDKAVYAIHGDPPAGFSVENLTKELGAPTQWAVKATEQVVYFWDVDKGVWSYDGKKFEWLFEPIYRLIDDEKINVQFSNQCIVEFHRDRLWVSVPMVAPPYDDQFISLVYQPSAGKNGAWTLHTATLFGWWIHRGSDGGDEHLIGGLFDDAPNGLVYELDVENLFQDELLPAGGDNRFIEAWYTTRWFDANNSAMKKRWKRPIFVMRGGQNQTTIGEVLQDYDPTKVAKTFKLTTTLPAETVKQAYLELTAGDEEAFTPTAVINPVGVVVLGIDIDPDAILGTFQTLIAKWDAAAGDNRSFLFQISDTGVLRFLTSDNGTAGDILVETCTVALPDANRRTVWVEYNPDNGGGSRVTKFYTSDTISGTKTQLGATVTTAGTQQIFDSTRAIEIGLHSITGEEPYLGKVYAAEIREGSLSGTILARPNFVIQEPGTLFFADAFGVTWQLDSGAAIVDDSIVVGEEGIWDTDSWDTMFWAREVTLGGERSVILRGPPLGGGVARALRLKNTVQGQDWRIHGLTMKWIPRRIRN